MVMEASNEIVPVESTGHPSECNAGRITFISPRGEMSQLRSAFGSEGCSVAPPTTNNQQPTKNNQSPKFNFHLWSQPGYYLHPLMIMI
jgi:hypothetical protein